MTQRFKRVCQIIPDAVVDQDADSCLIAIIPIRGENNIKTLSGRGLFRRTAGPAVLATGGLSAPHRSLVRWRRTQSKAALVRAVTAKESDGRDLPVQRGGHGGAAGEHQSAGGWLGVDGVGTLAGGNLGHVSAPKEPPKTSFARQNWRLSAALLFIGP
jgi:hypothetical protein